MVIRELKVRLAILDSLDCASARGKMVMVLTLERRCVYRGDVSIHYGFEYMLHYRILLYLTDLSLKHYTFLNNLIQRSQPYDTLNSKPI